MKNIAIFGNQWGDEAKARCVHFMSKKYVFTVRTSGGANAGHTIYHNGKKIVRHLVPSTDFSIPQNIGFLGAGMVINLEELLNEVKEAETNFPGSSKRIIVDPDAFVVLDKHIEEDKAKNKYIGSTNKGITPAYRDKIGRVGTKIRSLLQDNSEITTSLQKLGVQFKYVLELKEIMERNAVLFEGSQSIQLDYNFGDYPFVTSGECGLGGIYNSGFAFAAPTKIYGIFKPYLTKAGGGDSKFITEMPEEETKILQTRGNEIGATTQRPRRIGYLDLPALKYSCIKGGITHLICTKMDILNGFDKIKVCYDYGASPMWSGNHYSEATPNYTHLPGWKDARYPDQIRPFIKHIEDFTGIKVEYVSVGVNDEDMIKLDTSSQNLTPPKQENGFIKYGENPETNSTKLDKSFKQVGFPTLTEILSETIKKRILK